MAASALVVQTFPSAGFSLSLFSKHTSTAMNQYYKLTKSIARSKMIGYEFFGKWRHFSFTYALASTAWWIGWYAPALRAICHWAHKKKTIYLTKFLHEHYANLLSSYKKCDLTSLDTINKDEYFIWVFWAQGIENAPELVKSCYSQLKKECNSSVKLITMENVRSYVDIPDYIFERVDSGNVTLTHFSDILRVSLLAKYGGLWVDSTCWLKYAPPMDLKELKFFSPKTLNQPDLPMWSNSKWCGWALGTNVKNYPLFCFLRDMLYEYHRNEKFLIDYVFLDFLIYISYTEFPCAREAINSCPENNIKRNELHYLLRQPYSAEDYNSLEPTWLFKLSYKTPWPEINQHGKMTFFGFIKSAMDNEQYSS